MFPAFDILYLIEKQHRTSVAQSCMDFQNQVQICKFHPCKTFILKIYINDLLPRKTIRDQFLDFSIEKIGFSGATCTNQHLTVKPIK